MGGGLMQLVAYGAQDVYLTGNPQITFWKVTYRRHTNFSMEAIEQTFNGQADFGRRVTCTVSRNGDLAYRTYLQVTLPGIDQTLADTGNEVTARWLDFPGEQIINQVEVEIGGQRIDRQYGDWMHIWNQLTLSSEQERAYHQMIGHTTQLTYLTDPSWADVDGPCDPSGQNQVCTPRNALPESTLYIPLQFWFCRNPGLALPLIALQYHEVKINLDLRSIDECLWAVQKAKPTVSATTTTDATKCTRAYQQSLVAASLYIDYVFLDTDERRRMAQNPHEYLIEQLQFTGDESIGSSSNKIKLNFNHPCKEIIWVVQPDAHVDYCASLIGGETLFKTLGAQPFNYTDAIDALPNTLLAYGSGETIGWTDVTDITDAGFTDWIATGPKDTNGADYDINQIGLDAYNAFMSKTGFINGTDGRFQLERPAGYAADGAAVSDAGTFVLGETAIDMHCWGQNPVVTAKLQLNGQDRFSEREGTYFDLVQPFQHHTRNPDTGINCYSFGLRPEEHQPSGTCNFSRIDNATLQLAISHDAIGASKTAKVRVYAVNYNVLRVLSGMAGLAYSN